MFSLQQDCFFCKNKTKSENPTTLQSFIRLKKKLRGKWLLTLVQLFNDVITNVSEVLLSSQFQDGCFSSSHHIHSKQGGDSITALILFIKKSETSPELPYLACACVSFPRVVAHSQSWPKSWKSEYTYEVTYIAARDKIQGSRRWILG